MSEKLPFEADGRPQDDQSVPGLPFEPTSDAPLPFALNDEAPAPLPFAMDSEPAIPALPFSLDDEDPAPALRSFDEPGHFSLDAEPAIPPLPFSLDNEPQPLTFETDEDRHYSLEASEDRHFSLDAEPAIPALPFSLDAEHDAPALPFSLDAEPEAPALPFAQQEDPAIAPLPFTLDEAPVSEPPSFELESKIPPLPFSLDDETLESPVFQRQDEPVAESKPELSGAGFLFEEGEIDSPLFRRLAQQQEEPARPKMPPMGVPAMPPAARPAASAEPPAPPPFPPAYEPARPAMETPSRPVPPPPPGYQPPPPPGYQPPAPTFEATSRPVPPAINYEPPSPPPAPGYESPGQAGVIDLSQYEPMTPPSNSKAPILTGDAVPTHEAAPVAKDVSSALAAMKARLASSRQAQPDPNADLLKDPSEGMDMSLAPKSSKPPEIWEYRVGQSIFREGELTYELFMLMEGIVDIYVGGDKVATLNAETAAGAYLGEIGALLRLPRTATVKAVTSCKFLVFPDAKRLFEEDPEFGIKLSTILAQRLARSNESMEMVMRALYRAKVKDEVISAVKGAFQGKESTYYRKKGLFG